MTDPNSDAPSLASVAFIRIAEFARLAVPEQAQLKASLEALLAEVANALAQDHRIVLDAPDGQALVVLDNPGAALQAAEAALAASAGQPFRIGLNHGPVRRAPGHARADALTGDGLLAAGVAAGFATPGRLFATRAFRDALAAQAPRRAQALVPAGLFTDVKVRSHEMFAHDRQAAGRRRRRLSLLAALGCAAILALGYGARLWRLEEMRLAQPAVLLLDIKPYGDISVDGVVKGRSPPLTQIELKAGPHKVEVRFGGQPPLLRDLDLQPGQHIGIAHRFHVAPKPAAPKAAAGQPAQPGFWESLKKKLGGDK